MRHLLLPHVCWTGSHSFPERRAVQLLDHSSVPTQRKHHRGSVVQCAAHSGRDRPLKPLTFYGDIRRVPSGSCYRPNSDHSWGLRHSLGDTRTV
uniref:Putative secreted protein n=1 Tax=Ixodes scapularis TaxID=6945 RepID=A0A4D5RVB7_IXOSC